MMKRECMDPFITSAHLAGLNIESEFDKKWTIWTIIFARIINHEPNAIRTG
jgi:hypothetical protein